MQTIRFLQLSKPRQVLIRLCQRVNYGSILNLLVVNSDVCFDPLPEVVFDVRLDSEVTQRDELDHTDFALPVESCRLLAQIDSLKNGVVEKIIVHDAYRGGCSCAGPFREYDYESTRNLPSRGPGRHCGSRRSP